MKIIQVGSTSESTYLFKIDDNEKVIDAIPLILSPSSIPNILMVGATEDGKTPMIELGKVSRIKFQKAMREKLAGKDLKDAINALPERKAWIIENYFSVEEFEIILTNNEKE
jgi:hypothetical protein